MKAKKLNWRLNVENECQPVLDGGGSRIAWHDGGWTLSIIKTSMIALTLNIPTATLLLASLQENPGCALQQRQENSTGDVATSW